MENCYCYVYKDKLFALRRQLSSSDELVATQTALLYESKETMREMERLIGQWRQVHTTLTQTTNKIKTEYKAMRSGRRVYN